MPLLTLADWTLRAADHLARVGTWADAFVDRRSRSAKHPVHDFLFTYYSFSPAKLKQWLPSIGEHIAIDDSSLEAHPWLRNRWCKIEDGTLALDTSLIDARTRSLASFVAELCDAVLDRAPRLRCFGLHEWAMVYQQPREQVRHAGYELRLSPEETASSIESQSLCCSHYDAFRFFTPSARPLNALQPDLASRIANEQGACLHANMDLYKWATKLWPWTSSELIADAFLLALKGRDLDMRASPYDLAALGYEPVRIETEDGRRQYQLEQQQLAECAVPVRQRLRAAASNILTCHSRA